MEFNEKLQELRKQRGLTQEELAEKLYVSRTAISKWESGRGYCQEKHGLQFVKIHGLQLIRPINLERRRSRSGKFIGRALGGEDLRLSNTRV